MEGLAGIRRCPQCHRMMGKVFMGQITQKQAWMCKHTDCDVLFVGDDGKPFWRAPELP